MVVGVRHLCLLLSFFLIGCSNPISESTPPPLKSALSDPIMVIAQLKDQLTQWYHTPYRYGGMDKQGVDCSGFVYRTFNDRFNIRLPRTTREQTKFGIRINRKDLMPGDLVFFKTGSGESGLHVGIYDTDNEFIHASTSKGVIRSSLDNVYWRRVFWQARRM
ncbi:C40 family peptidase [Xenorhabdus sp. 42]|uniref:C40 family peptidase n=1 Tax=Xenorhabdus szentirmaii TaxID=290112 RepID=UPI000C03CE24|nr:MULTISPECIES: NlpC/P60 family protein [Xenorhabdus]MBD2779732.1 C40 family peptidase [Xenorhabdus sp. 38]MBD2804555.1 C40 family peptidase [Xenorhabdus sp. ZM]MBD2819585.1 C40 family peptidase [Xenorhabdus sp. 42]PHM41344.1 lipoprotein [Xenorhabdus szentirmaii]